MTWSVLYLTAIEISSLRTGVAITQTARATTGKCIGGCSGRSSFALCLHRLLRAPRLRIWSPSIQREEPIAHNSDEMIHAVLICLPALPHPPRAPLTYLLLGHRLHSRPALPLQSTPRACPA